MPVRRWFARTTLLAAGLLPAPAGLPAQDRPAPFETLDVSVVVQADVNDGLLQRDWKSGLTVGGRVALPFYRGAVETGVEFAHPMARRGDVPGFRSLFLYAGWGAAHGLPRRLRLQGSLRGGVLLLSFDGDSIPEFRRRESELGLDARAGLRYRLAGPWHAEASTSYRVVFTRPRIEQIFLALALGRRFRSPRWLRDFLD